MKRIFSMILALALVIACLPVFQLEVHAVTTVASGTCGDNLTWTLDDAGTLTISGTGKMGNYTYYTVAPWGDYRSAIKTVVIENGVTRIGEYAFFECTSLTSVTIANSVTSLGADSFYGCTSLTSVIIPDSVTTIGYDAFSGCTGLTSVMIPDSVTTIGRNAFGDCDSLTSVMIPASVINLAPTAFSGCYSLTEIKVDKQNPEYSSDSYGVFNKSKTTLVICPSGITGEYIIPDSVTTIGESAFSSCDNLTSVTIPDSVTAIGAAAFSYCESLTSVMIGNSVTSIGEFAFYECNSLTSVTIGNSVDSIGRYAFCSCKSLTSVTIPNSVTSIGELAFSSCTGLTSVTISNSVTTISWEMFSDCSNLTSVTIPDSVTAIGTSAFANCDSLTDVKIPDSVTTIGNSAFYHCDSLTSVTIPHSVTRIDEHAFSHCSSLTEIKVDKNNPKYSSDSYGVFDKAKTTLVICPGGKTGEYTIPDYVTTIGEYAFAYCDSLTDVKIPDSVTTIGERAFAYCDSLTDVKIPDSVTTIGESAFLYCVSLTSVTIPDSVTTIGEYAFAHCGGLTNVTIGNSVTYISRLMFSHCSNLTSVTIPDSVTTIGSCAFENCNSLTSVMIPASVINLAPTAFSGCYSLTEIKVDKQNPEYSSDSYGVFNKSKTTLVICPSGITGEYIIPDSVTYIGNYAFSSCDNLISVTIPDSVTRIGKHAFERCGGLTNVTIPDSVTYIWDRAFEHCDSLTSVTIGNSVTSIGEHAFSHCTQLSEIFFTGTAPSIQDYAFWYVTATAYYPADDSTWTKNVRQNYDGTLTWVPYHVVHTCNYIPVVTAPTCTQQGYTTYTCSACGDSYIDDYVSSLGHAMGSWYTTKEVTCTRDGEQRRDCSRCDHYETQVITSNGHSYTAKVTAPTCTEQGYTTYTCRCGDSYVSDYVASLGHAMGKWYITKEATCTEDGEQCRDCSRCDHYETQVITSNGHSYSKKVTAPTCTEQGYTTYTCRCGDSYISDYVASLGHDMGKWYITKEATCTNDGEQRRDCSRCGHFETQVITSNGHSYSQKVTAPTCTDQGYTTHTCHCGDSYVDTYKNALGHDWGQWYEVTKATPYGDGSERRDCGRCDHFETRTVPYQGNGLKLPDEYFAGHDTVWIEGLPYPIQGEGNDRYVELPTEDDCYMVTYTYHTGDASDIHTQYPTGMKVYKVSDGQITYIPELDNLLQYSGASIRITGKKGIRMITSLTKTNKTALTGKGLAGFKLLEYGTALCFAHEIPQGDALVLGRDFTRSNYAYKKGVADPVFASTKDLIQYTNVLVGFSLDQCKDDIAMRPYIILEDAAGNQITLYGGTIYRSIGYIAYQNRTVFKPKTASYNYVWELIHHVYGDQYDADYKG